MPAKQMSLFDLPEFDDKEFDDGTATEILERKREKQEAKVKNQETAAREADRQRQENASMELGKHVSRLRFWLARVERQDGSQNWKLCEEEVREFIRIYDARHYPELDKVSRRLLLRQLVGQAQLIVVRMLGIYRRVNKLGNNLNPHCPENRHKVMHVEDKYFDGKYGNVKDYEGLVSGRLDDALAIQECVCTLAGIEPVTRDWLCEHLRDGQDYASYRSKIKTRVKKPEKYPPISLKDIPPRK